MLIIRDIQCKIEYFSTLITDIYFHSNASLCSSNGEFKQIHGNAKASNPSESAKLLLSLFVFGPIQAHSDYWVKIKKSLKIGILKKL